MITDFDFSQHITQAPDPLGLLRVLVGGQPGHMHSQKWTGNGFNMLWRPNHNQSGPLDFFLQMMFTTEVLEFTDISGTGIANRGFLQDDISLGAVAYHQVIKDAFDESGQHFEPGVWINVPATTNPNEPPTIARMGSIPHGVAINLQGTASTVLAPQFPPISIKPFPIGNAQNPISFPAQTLTDQTQANSRTPINRIAALLQSELDDPNQFLIAANANVRIANTTLLDVSANTSPNTVPNTGGGIVDIAFLVGSPPNANVGDARAMFWIEELTDGSFQLQYSQQVLLNFNGLSWPHVSVATLHAEV